MNDELFLSAALEWLRLRLRLHAGDDISGHHIEAAEAEMATHASGSALAWDGRGVQVGFAVARERLLEAGFWVVAIALAGGQAWASRHYPSTVDLVSYLDTADAYARGDWHGAINAYWNPLYSWLLAAVFAVTRPSPEFEYPVAKLLDFGIFVGCLWSFSWFLAQLRRAPEEALVVVLAVVCAERLVFAVGRFGERTQ